MRWLAIVCLGFLSACAASRSPVENDIAAPAANRTAEVNPEHDLSDPHFQMYVSSVRAAILQNWHRPDDLPRRVGCKVAITQIPGGQVIAVSVLPSCPYGSVGRRTVKAAVLHASPLPYKGFESEFVSYIILDFAVDTPEAPWSTSQQ